MINHYSRTITEVRIGERNYIHKGRELVAIKNPEKKVFYVDSLHFHSKAVIGCIKASYDYIHKGFDIVECYDIKNMVEVETAPRKVLKIIKGYYGSNRMKAITLDFGDGGEQLVFEVVGDKMDNADRFTKILISATKTKMEIACVGRWDEE